MSNDFQRSETLKVALAIAKETDFLTPLLDAAIGVVLPFNGFGVAPLKREIEDDSKFFGKGHGDPTEIRPMGDQWGASRTYRASDKSLALLLPLLLGNVVTYTPTIATTARRHIVKFWDPIGGSNEALSTSWIEAYADTQKKISGVVISQVQLNAAKKYQVDLVTQYLARLAVDNVAVLPAVFSTAKFLRLEKIELGTFATLVDVSKKVTNVAITFNQNPQLMFTPGAPTGQEYYANVALIGSQTATLDLTLAYANALADYTVDGTELRCRITFKGATIETNFDVEMIVDFPRMVVDNDAVSDNNSTLSLALKFSEKTVLRHETTIASGTATSGTTSSLTKTAETFVTKGVKEGALITMNTGAEGALETRTIIEDSLAETTVHFTPVATNAVTSTTTFSVTQGSKVVVTLQNAETVLPRQ
jgi:hypothetical protein